MQINGSMPEQSYQMRPAAKASTGNLESNQVQAESSQLASGNIDGFVRTTTATTTEEKPPEEQSAPRKAKWGGLKGLFGKIGKFFKNLFNKVTSAITDVADVIWNGSSSGSAYVPPEQQ